MRYFVALCLSRPITTLTLHVVLLAMGAMALTRLPLNATPDSERPRVRVEIPYPNANPDQVEQEVTRKVEEALATLRGIQSISSESETGSSSVDVEFAWGTNLDLAKLEVRERLARIQHELPVADLERIQIRGAWGSGDAVIRGRISAKGIDLSKNYELLVNRLLRPLERIEGVAQVEMDGVTPLEIQITFRQDDLDRHGLDVNQLMARLEDNNLDRTIGEVIDDGKLRRVRITNAMRDVDDVRAFPINANGLRLDQVASIELREGDKRFGRHLNQRFAVSVEVFKESTANTVEVCERVLARIAEMKDDPQLAGVDLLVWEDQGAMILDALAGLKNAGLLGSAMALVILFIFLRRWSATLLVGMSIPISVLSALAFLYLMGRDLNILTIVALMLGVGMLVDTAVVVVESIVRLNAEGHDLREASVRGTMEVATPIFAATLTSIIVFIPVVFGGQSRMTDYIRELGLVISLTLTAALFVSLTLIPMVAARIYRPGEHDPGRWFRPVQEAYARLLAGALARPGLTLAVTAALCASMVLPFEWGFRVDLEDIEEHSQNVGVFYTPEGSIDWQSMEKHVATVEAVLMAHREEIGFGDLYSWFEDNFAWTAMYPRDRNADDATLAAMRARAQPLLPQIPGVQVRTGDWGMFYGGGHRARSSGSLRVRVYGDSSERIKTLLDDLEQRCQGISGVSQVERRVRDSVDEITVRPTAELLNRFGLSTQELSREIQAGFSNSFLREIRNGDGELRLRVALDDGEKDSLPELHALPIPTGAGRQLPLASLTRIEQGEGPGERRRENRQSSGSLSISALPELQESVRTSVVHTLAAYEWPKGYSYDLGDGWRQQSENQQTFGLGILLAVFLVYLVMACLFESLAQPLVLMLTVLLALPGTVWFLYLLGDNVDLPASIGLILLVGIVVNNGIVMIDHINRYRQSTTDLTAAIIRGGKERLRPVLITALTTIIGLLPLAFGHAKAANIYYSSLARTIVGGLAASTLLTLVVLPVAIHLVHRCRRRATRPLS